MTVQPYLTGMEDEERRRDLSQFYTPPQLAQRLWNWAPKPRRGGEFTVLEPSAGQGALIKPMLEGPNRPTLIVAYETDPRNVAKLVELAAGTHDVDIIVRPRDFLADPDPGRFDLAVQNPPYEDDQVDAFILAALRCAPQTCGIFPSGLPYSDGRWRRLWRHVDVRRQAKLGRVKFGGDYQPMTDFMAADLHQRRVPREKGEPMTLTQEWW